MHFQVHFLGTLRNCLVGEHTAQNEKTSLVPKNNDVLVAPRAGLEALPKTLGDNDVSEIGGADTVQIKSGYADLRSLVEAWPTLAEDVRAAILQQAGLESGTK